MNTSRSLTVVAQSGKTPPLYLRLYSVWYRHMRVYTKNLITNGFPPFLEPLIFLAAIGVGLGRFVTEMKGMAYLPFLGSGLLVTAAMFTAAFECSYGTFIRLEYDKAYDGMISAPITVGNLFIGEILWCGTKGFFFTFAVLSVVSAFGVLSFTGSILSPLVGFLTGVMFASLSLLVTSFIKDINQFNFYFTGFLSPMFFFSGVVFSLENLSPALQRLAEIFPLTHAVRLVRAVCFHKWDSLLLLDVAYMVAVTSITAFFAIRRLRRKLIS
jgi:lipooligosaccharide transport system permease protein